MARELITTGNVTADGKLKMYMAELNEYCSRHKGERLIITITPESEKASEAIKGYYYNYVVRKFNQARAESGVRENEEETEYFLRTLSPYTSKAQYDEQTGKYRGIMREIKDLTNAELAEHIEHLAQIGAEEYSIYIEEPR